MAGLKMAPPELIPTCSWMEDYLTLPELVSPLGGTYQFYYAPYMRGIVAAFDDPKIPEVVTQKPAQIGYTQAVVGYLGRLIDRDPQAVIMLFADIQSAREFVDEKFNPVVEASPILSRALKPPGQRKRTRMLFQKFPGGLIKLGGSKSLRTVKSTFAQTVIVEEPDDAEENLKEQGDAIKLLYQRAKRARNGGKRILGGTPSVAGISRVEKHIAESDKCVLPVRCHACEQAHVLDFENVRWPEKTKAEESIDADEVRYECPYCHELWTDAQRQDNVRETVASAVAKRDPYCGWVPTAPYRFSRGFYRFSDLYSCLPGSNLADIVKDYLTAQRRREDGDETAWIVFVNSVLGAAYKYEPKQVVALSSMRPSENYKENEIPTGGLLYTCGVDVQHDRIAIIRRAWGIGAENWLLYWGEIAAEHTTIDPKDRVWTDIETLIYSPLQSIDGWSAYPAAVTIDAGDGYTAEAVYAWVRAMRQKYKGVMTMAGKGSSRIGSEIYARPPNSAYIDHRSATKADKHGVQVYIVGTSKAKDWIYGKLPLLGDGAGRFHWYSNVRGDYQSQLLSETKVPTKTRGHAYLLRPGCRNEALDCEVYALHAAWAKRVHLLNPRAWAAIEAKHRQLDLGIDPNAEPRTAGDILGNLQ